jgi:hypothetical protein
MKNIRRGKLLSTRKIINVTGSNVIAPNFPKKLLELSLYKKILPCDPEQMD